MVYEKHGDVYENSGASQNLWLSLILSQALTNVPSVCTSLQECVVNLNQLAKKQLFEKWNEKALVLTFKKLVIFDKFCSHLFNHLCITIHRKFAEFFQLSSPQIFLLSWDRTKQDTIQIVKHQKYQALNISTRVCSFWLFQLMTPF